MAHFWPALAAAMPDKEHISSQRLEVTNVITKKWRKTHQPDSVFSKLITHFEVKPFLILCVPIHKELPGSASVARTVLINNVKVNNIGSKGWAGFT